MPCVVLGLGGSMNLAAAGGRTRQVRADDFLLAPLETARAEDELLVSITLPAPGAAAGSAYKKWGLVTDALPVAGVCVLVRLDARGKCQSARVSLAGLAAGAHRSPAAEQALQGSSGDAASIAQAFAKAAAAADAQGDKWAHADYRRQLIRSLGAEVAASAFARARAATEESREGARP
jgi:CO/xanthine dehydrogenase FAD-binding subunit